MRVSKDYVGKYIVYDARKDGAPWFELGKIEDVSLSGVLPRYWVKILMRYDNEDKNHGYIQDLTPVGMSGRELEHTELVSEMSNEMKEFVFNTIFPPTRKR